MAYDSDAFNRWEAGQVARVTRILLAGVESLRAGREMASPAAFIEAIGRVLTDGSRDPAFAAECLQLPVGELPRRVHGRGRSRRDPRRAHEAHARHRDALPHALRGRVPPLHRARALLAGRRRRRDAGRCATPRSPT